MKKSLIPILVLALFIGGLTTALAQEAKTERQIAREWKKRLRAMNPLEFKALHEEHAMLKAENTRISTDLVTTMSQLDSAKQEVEAYRSTVSVQKESYNDLMAKYEDLSAQMESSSAFVTASEPAAKKSKGAIGGSKNLAGGEALTKSAGVVFSVQVGIVERQEVAHKFAKSAILVKDASSGTTRVMMGAFRNFASADVLKEQMRELGIRDAWVVAYKDGQRISVSSAMAAGYSSPAATASR